MIQIHSWQNKNWLSYEKSVCFNAKVSISSVLLGLSENSGLDELIINMMFHYLTNKEDLVALHNINRTHMLDSN